LTVLSLGLDRWTSVVGRAIDAQLGRQGVIVRLGLNACQSAASIGHELAKSMLAGPASPPGRRRPEEPRPQGKAAGPAALVLEGAPGVTAVGAFLVTNRLEHAVQTSAELSELVSDAGERARLACRFEPGQIALASEHQQIVRLGVLIAPELRPGTSYRGTIAMANLPGTRIAVLVRAVPPHR
jgi:hypothetical protein